MYRLIALLILGFAACASPPNIDDPLPALPDAGRCTSIDAHAATGEAREDREGTVRFVARLPDDAIMAITIRAPRTGRTITLEPAADCRACVHFWREREDEASRARQGRLRLDPAASGRLVGYVAELVFDEDDGCVVMPAFHFDVALGTAETPWPSLDGAPAPALDAWAAPLSD